MRRLSLVLYSAAAFFTLAGVTLRFMPPDVAITPLPVAELFPPPNGTIAGPLAADSLAEEIVMANVFSATRKAPTARVVPPEFGDTANGAVMDSADETTSRHFGVAPVLSGTVVTPEGARALLQLDPASRPRLYAVGDRAGAYRVMAITAREVTLAGPGGRVVVKLQRKEDQPR